MSSRDYQGKLYHCCSFFVCIGWQSGSVIKPLLNLLLPDFCVGCDRIGTQLCHTCRSHICFVDQRHSQAVRETTHIQKIWSCVEYRDMAHELVKAVKYDRYWSYTKIMARLMFHSFESQLRDAGVEVFLPVPLASQRKRWRGFNQAECLAQELGKLLNLPIETHALRRTTARTNQAKLNKVERQSLEHDYMARPNFLTSKTVCLVDDVTTTGATLEACAAALNQVGIQKIYATTFAAA